MHALLYPRTMASPKLEGGFMKGRGEVPCSVWGTQPRRIDLLCDQLCDGLSNRTPSPPLQVCSGLAPALEGAILWP